MLKLLFLFIVTGISKIVTGNVLYTHILFCDHALKNNRGALFFALYLYLYIFVYQFNSSFVCLSSALYLLFYIYNCRRELVQPKHARLFTLTIVFSIATLSALLIFMWKTTLLSNFFILNFGCNLAFYKIFKTDPNLE